MKYDKDIPIHIIVTNIEFKIIMNALLMHHMHLREKLFLNLEDNVGLEGIDRNYLHALRDLIQEIQEIQELLDKK